MELNNRRRWTCRRGCERIDRTNYFVCQRCRSRRMNDANTNVEKENVKENNDNKKIQLKFNMPNMENFKFSDMFSKGMDFLKSNLANDE